MAVAGDVHLEPGGQRVHHRDADAVQAATDVVATVLAAELAARVQLGHHDVDRGRAAGVHLDRDAAAVVGDLDATVLEDPDVDLRRVSGHRLVDGVVDDLPDEVVQTSLAGGADIHARAFADRLQTFEHGDRGGAVLLLFRALRSGRSLLSGRHGRQHLLGGRSGGVGTACKSLVQSTGN